MDEYSMYLPTQRQNDGTDCGGHAVATAVEFLHEGGDQTADFAVERIREHLITCLENDSFTILGGISARPMCLILYCIWSEILTRLLLILGLF